MLVGRSSPFGSQSRTSSLLALALLEESYPREIARMLDSPLAGIQRALKTLERDGLVAARTVGRTRMYRINPRYFARAELNRFLQRLAEVESGLRKEAAGIRRRPRRTGKRL